MRSREEGSVVDYRFLVGRLAREWILSGFLLVYVPILLLLLCTHLLVVFLELLGGCKSWQQWKVRCHLFYNLP